MPNPDLASERRAFEATFPAKDAPMNWLQRKRNGEYRDSRVQFGWACWLARSAIPEITEEMVGLAAEAAGDQLIESPLFEFVAGVPSIDLMASSPSGWMINCTKLAKVCLTAALSIPHSTVKEDVG